MRIRTIASTLLALGLSAAVPTMAQADHQRVHRDDERYHARHAPEVCRDFDVNVSLRDVPRCVIETLNCESRGPIDSIQHVSRDGRFFYRFGIGGHRDTETVVRIAADGHLLTVGEVEKCEPSYSRDDHREWRR